MARPTHRRHGRATRLLALLCTALLACTTVRTHVSTIAPEVLLREGHAALQLDLWVESNRPLTLDEELRYRAQARQALEQAVAGRAQREGSGALVVRTLGVTRTPERRGDQAGAAVGIAVGIVVVVAVIIIAAVAGGKDGGGGSSSVGAPRLAPPAPRFSGPAAPVRPPSFHAPPRFTSVPRPSRPPAPRPPAPRGGHRPGAGPAAPRFPELHRGPTVDVGVGLEWWVPLGPEPEPLPPPAEPPPYAAEVPAAPADEAARAAPADEAPQAGPAPRKVPLAPPEPLPVERRGFFDGDRLVLDAVMVDPASGEALWRKRVARSVDPRDVEAVRAAVDALLEDGGWTPASAPPGS